jgi:hypothetical protein
MIYVGIRSRRELILVLVTSLCICACGPIESGVIDSGAFNTGGTNNPRVLIKVAYSRMYGSNRVDGARNVLKRAIAISKKENDHYALAVSYNMMGYTYIHKEKDPVSAERYYEKALRIATSHDHKCEVVHAFVGFALSNSLKGIPENSCVFKEKAHSEYRSIMNAAESGSFCEGGMESIRRAGKRVEELEAFLSCD